eukprot:390665-Rhodomonas_salina.3
MQQDSDSEYGGSGCETLTPKSNARNRNLSRFCTRNVGAVCAVSGPDIAHAALQGGAASRFNRGSTLLPELHIRCQMRPRTQQNQIQENPISGHFVTGMRDLVFDFGVY